MSMRLQIVKLMLGEVPEERQGVYRCNYVSYISVRLVASVYRNSLLRNTVSVLAILANCLAGIPLANRSACAKPMAIHSVWIILVI